MLEKEPSSYMEDSLEPSERTTQDQHHRKKVVKQVSNLNESFDEIETQKKPEKVSKISEKWKKELEQNQIIGYIYRI